MNENMTVAEAAKRLEKKCEFVRAGLRQQRFPFGTAVQSKSGRWNYHISTAKFWLYQYGFIPKDLINNTKDKQ